jgi:proliferating cell nuclear antigen PCNA
MRFVITDPVKAARFAAMFAQLKSFADCIVLRPGAHGIHMQCMDSSQVCLFDGRLAAAWFDEYVYTGDSEPDELGVVPRVLGMVLRAWKEGQQVEVQADGGDELHVTLSGHKEHLDKFFKVQLVAAEAQTLDLSTKGDSQVDLTLATKRMVELVGQLLLFDSVLRVDFGDNAISFESRGDEGGLRVEVALDDVTEYAIGAPLKQQFSLNYLQTICGFSKLCTELEMKFSADKPMEARYDLADDSHITLYLAPKITVDE